MRPFGALMLFSAELEANLHTVESTCKKHAHPVAKDLRAILRICLALQAARVKI